MLPRFKLRNCPNQIGKDQSQTISIIFLQRNNLIFPSIISKVYPIFNIYTIQIFYIFDNSIHVLDHNTFIFIGFSTFVPSRRIENQ